MACDRASLLLEEWWLAHVGGPRGEEGWDGWRVGARGVGTGWVLGGGEGLVEL